MEKILSQDEEYSSSVLSVFNSGEKKIFIEENEEKFRFMIEVGGDILSRREKKQRNDFQGNK